MLFVCKIITCVCACNYWHDLVVMIRSFRQNFVPKKSSFGGTLLIEFWKDRWSQKGGKGHFFFSIVRLPSNSLCDVLSAFFCWRNKKSGELLSWLWASIGRRRAIFALCCTAVVREGAIWEGHSVPCKYQLLPLGKAHQVPGKINHCKCYPCY